jgi:hypothetical protein
MMKLKKKALGFVLGFFRPIVPSDPKTIAVVGNGDVDPALAREIDSADIVVRFNKARNCGVAGRRTHILVLMNWSSPGERSARDPKSINPIARSASQFLLTADPKDLPALRKGRESDVPGDATPAILKLIVKGRPYSVLPLSNRLQTEEMLRKYGSRPDVIPSTGAQVINFLNLNYPRARMVLYGFSHTGWDGHCWDAERRWIASLLAEDSHISSSSDNTAT